MGSELSRRDLTPLLIGASQAATSESWRAESPCRSAANARRAPSALWFQRFCSTRTQPQPHAHRPFDRPRWHPDYVSECRGGGGLARDGAARFGSVSNSSTAAVAASENGQTRTSTGTAVVAAGVSIYVVAALTVAFIGEGQIRFTADSADTIPMWHPWLAAAVGIGRILITPTAGPIRGRARPAGWVRVEALVLLALALTFTVALTLLGPDEPNYKVLKLGLLLLGPLLLFTVCRRFGAATRRDGPAASPDPGDVSGVRRPWWPLVPAVGWTVTYLGLSLIHPGTGFEADMLTVIAMVLMGFLLNAVLEEFFYRRWLQTRWERVLGGVWPAIIVSSLTWASWHIAIQGTGDWVVDLANVVANQGVTGLFLGLLWERHRAMWPLLLVHGLMNANPLALF